MCKFGLKIQSCRTVMKGIVCLAAALGGVAAAAEDQMVVVRREDAKFVPLDPRARTKPTMPGYWVKAMPAFRIRLRPLKIDSRPSGLF